MKSLVMLPVLAFWAILATAGPALCGLVEGTSGDDIIFGDMRQFPGLSINGEKGLYAALKSLSISDMGKIGVKLELTGGIEEPTDKGDALYGKEGNDIIFGQGGDDFINAGPGADIIFAGSGNDIIIYDPEDIYIDGGSGIDILVSFQKIENMAMLNKHINNIEAVLAASPDNLEDLLKGWELRGQNIELDKQVWKEEDVNKGIFKSHTGGAIFIKLSPDIHIIYK